MPQRLHVEQILKSDDIVQNVAGAGVGIGVVFAGLITGVARNPGIKSTLFSYAILGFALSEATGLFSLMMSFLLLYS